MYFLKITQSNIAAIEPESFESLVDIFENLILDIKPRGLTSHKIIDDILLNKNFDEKIIRSICLSGGNPDTKRYFFLRRMSLAEMALGERVTGRLKGNPL